MKQRALGSTGMMVSEVSMGCNRLGEETQSDEFWVDLVRLAVDLGVNLFDTSERYGGGRSEVILGRALHDQPDVLIASKVAGHGPDGGHNFGFDTIMERCETSLRKLRRETIDVYQLHSPNRQQLEEDGWIEALTRLKDQGKIRVPAVAIGPVDDGLMLIRRGLAGVLQVTYNIFETAAEEQLFEAARAAGVGVLVRMPLARGVLSGKFSSPEAITDEHRASLDGEKAARNVQRASDLMPLAADYPGGLTRLAHQFALAPAGVSAIIPGARTAEQIRSNVAASDEIGLRPGWRERIDTVCGGWKD